MEVAPGGLQASFQELCKWDMKNRVLSNAWINGIWTWRASGQLLVIVQKETCKKMIEIRKVFELVEKPSGQLLELCKGGLMENDIVLEGVGVNGTWTGSLQGSFQQLCKGSSKENGRVLQDVWIHWVWAGSCQGSSQQLCKGGLQENVSSGKCSNQLNLCLKPFRPAFSNCTKEHLKDRFLKNALINGIWTWRPPGQPWAIV